MRRMMGRTIGTATTLILTTAACLAATAPTATAAATDYICEVAGVTGYDYMDGTRNVMGWTCDPVPGGDPNLPLVIVADDLGQEFACKRVSLQGRDLTATGCL
ncbi:hypothetical protein [Streptomyces sp. NPDC058855]|uniref:hypothetical protein n=1 Tax=Streptomyces sp. NPDC058855 TaxID=3346651 RepID=UPI0036B282AE